MSDREFYFPTPAPDPRADAAREIMRRHIDSAMSKQADALELLSAEAISSGCTPESHVLVQQTSDDRRTIRWWFEPKSVADAREWAVAPPD